MTGLRIGVQLLLPAVAVGFSASSAAGQGLSGKLLYVAVQPCRIVDTRIAGGPLAANSSRTFNVVGATPYGLQGGNASGCGIPGFVGSRPQVQAAMLNVIAVGANGPGDVRAWPSDQGKPNASVLNYANQGALAGLNIVNGLAVPVRQDSQGSDITVQADVSGTHLVVDIVGYFTKAARTYYATTSAVQGSAALTACAAGYHMAALYEMQQPSDLEYDNALGATSLDGGGPPTALSAWIRTGFGISTSTPGAASCVNWTSNASSDFGTIVSLPANWTISATVIAPWFAQALSCNQSGPVWCIED
jgi:hypothetical protein